MIPWRRLKWALVRYLVGRRQCVMNVSLNLAGTLELEEGSYISGTYITGTIRDGGPWSPLLSTEVAES